jgi:MOSC domain-containing protein YiiM
LYPLAIFRIQSWMKLVSLNAGLPREVPWHGRMVTTSIFKEPVAGRIALRKLNFDGDRQADLSVHGGEFKAVYAYPVEHYAYWREQLPGYELRFGAFGENLTTEGLLEGLVHLGDRFSVGSAELIVTQPRLPCYKLGVRFNSDDMVKRFLASARTGFYFSVSREGEVAAGDAIRRVHSDPRAVPVSEITRLYVAKNYTNADAPSIGRALRVPSFPDSWKQYLEERFSKTTA